MPRTAPPLTYDDTSERVSFSEQYPSEARSGRAANQGVGSEGIHHSFSHFSAGHDAVAVDPHARIEKECEKQDRTQLLSGDRVQVTQASLSQARDS